MSARSSTARRLLALVVALAAVTLEPTVAAAAEPPPPSIRLVRSAGSVTLDRHDGRVGLDLGVFVAAAGDDFRLHLRRPSWTSPLRVTQHGRGGKVIRPVPTELVDGWTGLRDFLEVSFRDVRGRTAATATLPFCPNGWEQQRVDDVGPDRPTYPTTCGNGFGFTRGMVWGIDEGWSTSTVTPFWHEEGDGATVEVPEGSYAVTVRIREEPAALFGVAAGDRSVTVRARVRDVEPFEPPHEEPVAVASSPAGSGTQVKTVSSPPAGAVLPDLAALPAWGLTVSHEDGRDLLDFASTPWNAGPGAFVVEGFRRRDAAVMDAYQYFYDGGGKVQGRAPIGDMAFHRGGGHDHWHFLQFAAFDLLARDGTTVVESLKQGFCMAPTDPVDLTGPGAVMRPWEGSTSSCGGPRSLWVREVLAAGWGDTYRNVSGQAFDVTDVPNGRYLVRVRVDPEGRLHQGRTDNDVALRSITLGGVAGARTVRVASWNGISD